MNTMQRIGLIDVDGHNFTPTCPRVIYKAQIQDMSRYIKVLERRAKIEGIELTD